MQLRNEVLKNVLVETANKVDQVYRAEARIKQAEHLACLFNVHADFDFEPHVMPHEYGVTICVQTERNLTKDQFQELAEKASLVCQEEEDRTFCYGNYTAFGIGGFDFQVILKSLKKPKSTAEKAVGSKS